MNFTKRMLMVVGFVVLAAAFVAMLAPKTAAKVISELVQVTNTTANPVPTTDASKWAANNVVLTCGVSGSGIPADNRLHCFQETPAAGEATAEYTVPAAMTLVITSIDITNQSESSVGVGIWNGPGYGTWGALAPPGITANYQLGTGIIFPAGTSINGQVPNGDWIGNLWLRGYLTPN